MEIVETRAVAVSLQKLPHLCVVSRYIEFEKRISRIVVEFCYSVTVNVAFKHLRVVS